MSENGENWWTMGLAAAAGAKLGGPMNGLPVPCSGRIAKSVVWCVLAGTYTCTARPSPIALDFAAN